MIDTPAHTTFIKAVLFDLDDTLFDHRGCARHALAALRQAYPCFASRSLEELEHDYHAFLEELHLKVLDGSMTPEQSRRERFRRLLERSGVAPTEAQVATVARFYHQAYLDAYQPVPGAIPLLTSLREHGLKIGIVTNNIVAEQVKKLKACGMEKLIDALVVSEEAGACKPDPAIFHTALARLACRPEEAVMIGDAWATDIEGARAAGIRAMWLNRLGLPAPDPALASEIHALEPVETLLELIYYKTGLN